MAVLPAFTHFIASNSMSETKAIALAIWFIAGGVGAIIGGTIAKHMDRQHAT